MGKSVQMVEVWRGPFAESVHRGHGVISRPGGEIVQAWGDPEAVVLPRSSVKMIQALPMIESGAAAAYGLHSEHLALACASHQGAPIHTARVSAWLETISRGEGDLRCGVQMPPDRATRELLVRADSPPSQLHNNCSGKHAGFLTWCAHCNSGPEYCEADHPLQIAVREAFEDVTGMVSPGYGIDGCSAPNFATTMHGLARAAAYFAGARPGQGARATAASQLVAAMADHPELVAGEGRACTGLMRAMGGRGVVKTGAEGVFVAILPEQQLGVAVKIMDGATRASECAIAAILVSLGVLSAEAAAPWMAPVIRNWRGIETGAIRPAPGVF